MNVIVSRRVTADRHLHAQEGYVTHGCYAKWDFCPMVYLDQSKVAPTV